MSEILDGYEIKPRRFYLLKSLSIFIGLVILVVILGIYAGNAIFGERSYTVLKDLQKQRVFLHKDVSCLKDENAKLQKLYLERVALDPDLKK